MFRKEHITLTIDTNISNKVVFDIWIQNPLMLIMSFIQANWCWILHAAQFGNLKDTAPSQPMTTTTLAIDHGTWINFGRVMLLKRKGILNNRVMLLKTKSIQTTG